MANAIRVKLTPFPAPVPGQLNTFRGIHVRLSRDGEGTTLAKKGSRASAILELHATFIDSLFPFRSRPTQKFATIEGEIELTAAPTRPLFTALQEAGEPRAITYEEPPVAEVRDTSRTTPRRKSVELEFESTNFSETGASGGPLGHLILPEFPDGARYLEIDTVLSIAGQEEAALEHSDLFDILVHRSSGDPVPPTTFGMRLVSEGALPEDIPFRVTDPDGAVFEGTLNQNGECFVDNLTVGDCLLELPSLAAQDWDAIPKNAPTSSRTASGEEDMPKIAFDEGFRDWTIIFDHPDNESLREQRPNPDQLAKGDTITIPAKDAEPVRASTGELHVFNLHREPTERLRLRIDSEVGFSYKLEVVGQVFRGTKRAGERIEHVVPRDATSATLELVHDGEDEALVFDLAIGALEPAETDRGVQARLTNLGFDTQGVDGSIGPKTKAALGRFQRFAGLEITGEADEATRAELREHHDQATSDEPELGGTGVGNRFDPETGEAI